MSQSRDGSFVPGADIPISQLLIGSSIKLKW
jgi:hypothetical protein